MNFPSGQAMKLSSITFGIITIIFVLSFAAPINAQNATVQITVLSLVPAKIKVEGKIKDGVHIWSFRQSYAGITGLGQRIDKFELMTTNGETLHSKKLAPGEYETESAATNFSYEVKLDPPFDTSDSAYISWLTQERGLFLLGDLLPSFLSETKSIEQINFDFALPSEWQVASVEREVAKRKFEVENVARAVFAIGPNLRIKHERIGNMEFDFVTNGEWMFADEDALEMATKVLKEHIAAFGDTPQRKAMLYLSQFPRSFGAQRWSAETRGRTVVLLSGKMPTKLSALIHLSSPLTHELFHLWLPNSLALDGDYDWFYEGFTIYQALRTGMRLNYFAFQDYLDALGRAYNAYQSEPRRDTLSLPDASRQRWLGENTIVYNKGMLVAFLYDLTLMQNSKGKRSLDDVLRELFTKHNSAKARADGNSAVIEILVQYKGMKEFVNRYIEKPITIDLQTMLAPFGLILEREGSKTRVRVHPTISRSQRALLKKFGYNDNLPQVSLNHQ